MRNPFLLLILTHYKVEYVESGSPFYQFIIWKEMDSVENGAKKSPDIVLGSEIVYVLVSV